MDANIHLWLVYIWDFIKLGWSEICLIRVEEVHQKEWEREKHEFKAHLADWSELARVWAIMILSTP